MAKILKYSQLVKEVEGTTDLEGFQEQAKFEEEEEKSTLYTA